MRCVLGSPPLQGEREGTQRKRETGAQVQVSAGLLYRNPALTCVLNSGQPICSAVYFLRHATETRKPRWASLRIAFGALPKRENLAGPRSESLSARHRNAKTSLGLAQKRSCTYLKSWSDTLKSALGRQEHKTVTF